MSERSEPKRVLVCGGRDFDDRQAVFAMLDHYRQNVLGDLTVIQGGASGADALARAWCSWRRVQYENYGANWTLHRKAAGPIRNQQMIDVGQPDLVLAFPGGRGTADMVRRARAAGIEVREVSHD